MKSLITLLTFFVVFNICAQEEEMQFLLSMQNHCTLETPGILAKDGCTTTGELANSLAGIKTLSNEILTINAGRHHVKKQRFHAYAVSHTVINGHNFHVADYQDGTRVVTCLSGEMRGLQGVGVNGILTQENPNAEWHKNHFVHYYTHGRILSYPTKQIFELYQF